MKTEIIETKTVKIWMDDGLMFITVLPGANLSLPDVKKNVEIMREFVSNQKRPVLV